MSTVFLSPVQSISKLDTFSGLPLPDDELGPTRSTPLLSESSSSPTRKNPEPISPLLDKVLRGAIGLRLDSASPEATSSLKNVSDRHDDVVKQGSTSSFTDILESRGSEMDQAWMEMQKSTFTNWLNDRLKAGRHGVPKVQDLSEDLRDGILLIKLLETLTKKKIKGYAKNPKMPAHKLVNLDLAFEFMKKEDVKLIGIGSLNVFEGNTKLTLGMIWTLIQKYQLRMKGYKVSTKDVMLQWIKALLPSWNISNFTSDWSNGRALIAIINAVKPGIAPNVSTLDPNKHRNNCALAIKIADVHLKIPKIISADDLSSGNIDELSMITYISYFVELARVKLLKWVRKALPRISINNFTSDWHDGRYFSALINSCFPGTLSHWMKMSSENALKNITEVHEVCTKKFGINPSFSISDLSDGKIEELQIMTLIMQIRNSELKSLPEAVVVNGPGLDKAQVGKETSFFIDTTEAGPGKLYIDLYYEDGKKIKFRLKEKVSGVLTLTYTPQSPGKVTFDILWSDIPVPNSPFSLRVTDSSLLHIMDFEHHSKLREVEKPIELKLDAKHSGTSNLSAYLQYSDNKEKIEAKTSILENFVVKLEYTPSRAGKAVLHVLLNNKEITNLAVPYTIVDSGGYMISTLPDKHIYHTFEEACFSVTSSKNLPLDVLQMTAILTSDIQIPIRFKSIKDNRGSASFKPTLPGVYKIEVVCVDQLIQGTPFTIQVTDPLSCKLNGKIPSFLELKKPYIFELDTKEAGVGSIMFECVDKNTSLFFKTAFRHQDDEHFKHLEVFPTVEGEYLVGIKYHDQWIASSPFRIQVCNPSKFTIGGDLVEKKAGVIGKPIRFRVESSETIDKNLVPEVKASGPSAKYATKVRLSEDKLSLTADFTPYEIGTHEVSVTFGGFHIPSSPLLLAVVAFDSNTCSATGTGLQEAYTNIPSQFVVLTKTSGFVEDGTLQVNVTGVINKVECRVRIRDNKNGLYNVAYMVTTPGAYLINVLAGGEHIAGSPFKLNAQPGPEAQRCRIYGSALEEDMILTIGKPIDFSVDASKGGIGKLNVKAIGPGGVQARVFIAKGNSKGLHDIKIDPVRHGKYRINVKWSGKHIPQSPFILKIFPGVDATKCKAYGSGLENGTVGTPTSFTIETKDAGPGTLRVCLHGVKDAFKIDIKPQNPKDVRTLIARYYPRKPGDYLISITWSNRHIPGSPFRVKISGEEMEDDFRPNKFKPTPRIEELQVIEEEDEENDDYEISSVTSKVKVKKPLEKGLTSSASLNEVTIPMFGTAVSRQGYHETFVHGDNSVKQNSKPLSQSLSGLEPEKMMTFSGLQKLRGKRKRAVTSPGRMNTKDKNGEFHGQAVLHVKTKNQ